MESTTMAAENVSWYAEREVRHKELVEETVEIGLMFASKAFVQLLANPIVGPLTHKYVLKVLEHTSSRYNVNSYLLQDRLQHTNVLRLRHHVLLHAE
jgi:hypothetical protein